MLFSYYCKLKLKLQILNKLNHNQMKTIVRLFAFLLAFVPFILFSQNFTEKVAFQNEKPGSGDIFGKSVSLEGDYLVVGSTHDKESSNGGALLVYKKSGSDASKWTFVKKLLTGVKGGSQFGKTQDISGTTLVGGAPEYWLREDGITIREGKAFIFEKNFGGSDNWGQLVELNPTTDRTTRDKFGEALSIDGDYVAVSGTGNAKAKGAVWVFKRNQGGDNKWGETAFVTAPTRKGDTYFGKAVELRGNMLFISQIKDNGDEGSVFLYTKEAGTENWKFVREITPESPVPNENFGKTVKTDGNYLFVSATKWNASTGIVYVFKKDKGGSGNWGQIATLEAYITSQYEEFGHDIALTDERVYVSSLENNVVYYFNRNGDKFIENPEKIKYSNSHEADGFGTSIAANGNLLVVGNPRGSSNYGKVAVYEYKNKTVAVSDIESLKENLIYPNPSKRNISLSLENVNSIKIYTYEGQFVREIKFGSGVSTKNIDLSSLKEGAYLIKITSGEVLITDKLIIKK